MIPRSILRLFAALPIAGLVAACTPPPAGPAPATASLDSLYLHAIEDAAVYRAENVLPLNYARPDAAGQVRVVTFTSWPGYTEGTDSIGINVWVTLVPEVRDSCSGFGADLRLRLNQLLGLPPAGGDTLMVEMTVPVAALFRPVADPAVTTRYPCGDSIQAGCGEAFPANVSAEHVRFIANQFLTRWQAPTGGYPWTRLGYTYNWHPGSPRYGVSEYLIRAGTVATNTHVQPVRAYCAA